MLYTGSNHTGTIHLYGSAGHGSISPSKNEPPTCCSILSGYSVAQGLGTCMKKTQNVCANMLTTTVPSEMKPLHVIWQSVSELLLEHMPPHPLSL